MAWHILSHEWMLEYNTFIGESFKVLIFLCLPCTYYSSKFCSFLSTCAFICDNKKNCEILRAIFRLQYQCSVYKFLWLKCGVSSVSYKSSSIGFVKLICFSLRRCSAAGTTKLWCLEGLAYQLSPHTLNKIQGMRDSHSSTDTDIVETT